MSFFRYNELSESRRHKPVSPQAVQGSFHKANPSQYPQTKNLMQSPKHYVIKSCDLNEFYVIEKYHIYDQMISNPPLVLVTVKQILAHSPNIPDSSTQRPHFPLTYKSQQLEPPHSFEMQPFPGCLILVQAAITEYHRLGGL